MEAELKNQIIVAASAAKAAGFEGTYDALLEMLRVMKSAKPPLTSHSYFAGEKQQLHS